MIDAKTIQFITDQNREQTEHLKDIILANGTLIRGKIESEIDRIDEMDRLRNGKIKENGDDINIIKKETRISRWAHRNPKVALIVFVAFVLLIATGFHTINVRRTIEKVMRIELNE